MHLQQSRRRRHASSALTLLPGHSGTLTVQLRVTITVPVYTQGPPPPMLDLDQIRRDIQARLQELWGEIDKLRRALAALASRGSEADDGDRTAPVASSASVGESAVKSPRASTRRAPRPRKASVPPRPATQTPASSAAAPAPARTAPGATKAAVLAALRDGRAMTAGEIAAASGLGRATVSTTLSKLAGSGEITKAARGYQLGRESDTNRKPARPRPSVTAATTPSPPVAEPPVAAPPVAEPPVAEEPVAEPPVAEEPVSELLVAEELVIEELVAEELVIEELVAEELAIEELVAEELIAEELVAEELVAEELVAEELVAEELVVEELVAEELVAEELVAEELVAEEPVTEELVGEALAAGAARPVSGATKRAVLGALAGGSAMTASEVAAATGLARASVSTTLSKLAKAGELTKAARGYQLVGAESSQRFYFRTEDAGAGAVVANLPELEAAIAVCEAGVLRAHCAERDFSRWVAGVLRNEALAAEIAAVEAQLSADSSTESVEHARQALIAALQARHATEQ